MAKIIQFFRRILGQDDTDIVKTIEADQMAVEAAKQAAAAVDSYFEKGFRAAGQFREFEKGYRAAAVQAAIPVTAERPKSAEQPEATIDPRKDRTQNVGQPEAPGNALDEFSGNAIASRSFFCQTVGKVCPFFTACQGAIRAFGCPYIDNALRHLVDEVNNG